MSGDVLIIYSGGGYSRRRQEAYKYHSLIFSLTGQVIREYNESLFTRRKLNDLKEKKRSKETWRFISITKNYIYLNSTFFFVYSFALYAHLHTLPTVKRDNLLHLLQWPSGIVFHHNPPWIRIDGNYTRMLRAILNQSWRQHSTKHQLYGHLPPITKTIQARRTRHAGHCWRSRDELISDVLLWTPTYGRAKAGRPTRTYIQQLCEDTGCSSEDLPEAMNDREKWWERVRDIRVGGTSWWWWWWSV